MLSVVHGFLQQYLDIEKLFSQGRSTESVVLGTSSSDFNTTPLVFTMASSKIRM